jgi:hypothetical protein
LFGVSGTKSSAGHFRSYQSPIKAEHVRSRVMAFRE